MTDKDTGKFYGTGFLTFASPEVAKKALSVNGIDVLGRKIRVEPETKKQGNTPNKGSRAPSSSKPLSERPAGCKTVFLGNLSFNIEDNAIHELFAECGEIKQIRWLHDKETNDFKGCGFVEFIDEESTTKAVAHNGEDVLGRSIRIDYSAPKADSRPPQKGKWN